MKKPKRAVRYGGAMIDDNEINAVVNVMKTSMVVGEKVQSFETRCAKVLGHKYGVMVNSGSSALLLAMHLLDLPKGSEVITPTLTFGTDISSITFAGYVPVLCDVVLDTYQIDLDKIERMISPKTKAMLIPNLIGGMPDWDRLREIADKHGLLLVEDSCDTLGSTYRGRPAGARADLSVTSFSIFHIITCLGNGGLVAFDSEKLWDRAVMLRNWGRASEKYTHGSQKRSGFIYQELDGIDYDGAFIFEEMAYGFVASEAGAAFGHAQLDKLEYFSELRRQRFDKYTAFMEKHEDVFIKARLNDGVKTTWICYPVQLRPQLGWKRHHLQTHMNELGVHTRTIFTGNAARQPMMKGREFRIDPKGCPNADQIMEYGVMLPCFPSMTDEDMDYVFEAIEDFIEIQRSRNS